jgi:hypothetical protein
MAKRKSDQSGNGTNGGEVEQRDAALSLDGEAGRIETESSNAIDPTELRDSPTPARKPRAPYGSKKAERAKRRSTGETESAQNLTGILLSLHMMGATLLKTPELELTEDEAAKLASAVARVNELCGGMVLPEKAAAWIQLIMVAGTIYGPRIIVIQAKGKQKKVEQEKPVVLDVWPVAQA